MKRADLFEAFRRERKKFESLFPRVTGTSLVISSASCVPESPCRGRDVAWSEWSSKNIWILDRALRLSRFHLLALIRHELGHIADPTPDRSDAENRADRLAKRATGVAIRYDSQGLQTLGKGGPRPSWLHR